MSSRKLNDYIECPISSFDIQDFVIGPERDNYDQTTYDLYGVSNHYGSLDGGHYTANCQNPI